jgi:hypothetical protein
MSVTPSWIKVRTLSALADWKVSEELFLKVDTDPPKLVSTATALRPLR